MNARWAGLSGQMLQCHFNISLGGLYRIFKAFNDDNYIGKFFRNGDVLLARHGNLFVRFLFIHFHGEPIRAEDYEELHADFSGETFATLWAVVNEFRD